MDDQEYILNRIFDSRGRHTEPAQVAPHELRMLRIDLPHRRRACGRQGLSFNLARLLQYRVPRGD